MDKMRHCRINIQRKEGDVHILVATRCLMTSCSDGVTPYNHVASITFTQYYGIKNIFLYRSIIEQVSENSYYFNVNKCLLVTRIPHIIQLHIYNQMPNHEKIYIHVTDRQQRKIRH